MLQNRPNLGVGVYTPSDISLILKIPNYRIRWYIDKVWDQRFGIKNFNERYSWDLQGHRAVNFLVLVEFKIVFQLKKLGLSTQKILKARNTIAKENNLPYPFASSRILANTMKIWYDAKGDIVDADGSEQTSFKEFVEKYYDCIDFKNELAHRFFPNGKDSSIVVDPNHQLGQPIILGTNITTDTIYRMHKAGDSIALLSDVYDLPEQKIRDAIKFYNNAA